MFEKANTKEIIKLITDFDDWLMANDPAPESVVEIRLYWQTKRMRLADKIVTHHIKRLKG